MTKEKLKEIHKTLVLMKLQLLQYSANENICTTDNSKCITHANVSGLLVELLKEINHG